MGRTLWKTAHRRIPAERVRFRASLSRFRPPPVVPGLFWLRAHVILLTAGPTRPTQRLGMPGTVPLFPHPEPPLLLILVGVAPLWEPTTGETKRCPVGSCSWPPKPSRYERDTRSRPAVARLVSWAGYGERRLRPWTPDATETSRATPTAPRLVRFVQQFKSENALRAKNLYSCGDKELRDS